MTITKKPNHAPVLGKNVPVGSLVRVDTDNSGHISTPGYGLDAQFSNDGSQMLFASKVNSLVAGDTNGYTDVFVKNLVTGNISRVSTDTSGVQFFSHNKDAVWMPDGQSVLFNSIADTDVAGVYIKNLHTGALTQVSTNAKGAAGNAASFLPGTFYNGGANTHSVSADGNKVVFTSDASNLVAGDTNDHTDVFVKNLTTGSVVRASVSSSGQQGNAFSDQASISADGTKVLFQSWATNLVRGDTNGQSDIFVKNLTTGALIRVNTDKLGNQALGGDSENASLSADGTKVLFESDANNLTPGDTNGQCDIFVKNLVTGKIVRVNTDGAGQQAVGGGSQKAVFSDDGTKVLFLSAAGNLTAGDTNGGNDLFVKDLVTGAIVQINTDPISKYNVARFSSDGTEVLFGANYIHPSTHKVNEVSGVFVKTIAAAPRIVDNVLLKTQSVSSHFTFSDADVGDTHKVSIDCGAHYGVLTTSLTEQGVSGTGQVSYTYTVNNAEIHKLAFNTTVHDTFHVTLSDGHGGSTVQNLTFDLLHPSTMIA